MMTWEMELAEQLVRQWHAGDQSCWLTLEDLIKKRLTEDVERWMTDMDSDDVAWARDSCLEIFQELQARQRFLFERRTNFQEIRAHVLRKVVAEIARRLRDTDS